MSNTFTHDSFGATDHFGTSGGRYRFFNLQKLTHTFPAIREWPYSIRILFESVLRSVDGVRITDDHVRAFAAYDPKNPADIEVPFKPARVLLQDFTGVPCVVDLAAMRSAMARLGGDPAKINPQLPVDLVIDHSLQVDHFAVPEAAALNSALEFARNRERYEFLRWGQAALRNFSVVPPASGICHQVNLEYFGSIARSEDPTTVADPIAYFDTLVGTDSHTTMINGLGILGWGVGGIEAEAAMLGQPLFMLAPPVVGVRISGHLAAGVTATDLVLRVTEMLRKFGVVNKIVEFFGSGLASMSVPDRATIANMAPEYGATAGFFPVDQQAIDYLYATGRSEETIAVAESYCRAQGMFRTETSADPQFQAVLDLDLSAIKPAIAGPKRPQDRIDLSDVQQTWRKSLSAAIEQRGYQLPPAEIGKKVAVTLDQGVGAGTTVQLGHGDVVIAAITSCTNTSNPSVLLAAGLLAKHAVEAGLATKPWVKTSFAPGSIVVTEYLKRAGLLPYLERLGFHLVGYGCTTCIGNSGPLPTAVANAVEQHNLVAAAVLSGNRNFEGRVNPHTKANFLMSPPLVVAYALAGSIDIDLAAAPIGTGKDGKPVFLHDIWPADAELGDYVQKALDRQTFITGYRGIETANGQWNAINVANTEVYTWDPESSYIHEPPFFETVTLDTNTIEPINDARALVVVGDSITTDHISPAGAIDSESPAGGYLRSIGVEAVDFNSYGSRRGNDQVMTRGTFANIRLRNRLAPGTEGSWTTFFGGDGTTAVVDINAAAQRYRSAGIPTVVLAGKDYGMGSSRDWAAKGVFLLGVRAVIAESFERIHRSNLVGMGVLPLEFADGAGVASLGLTGAETFAIPIADTLVPKQRVTVCAVRPDAAGKPFECRFDVICRIDSAVEVEYYRNGGILQTVLRDFLRE